MDNIPHDTGYMNYKNLTYLETLRKDIATNASELLQRSEQMILNIEDYEPAQPHPIIQTECQSKVQDALQVQKVSVTNGVACIDTEQINGINSLHKDDTKEHAHLPVSGTVSGIVKIGRTSYHDMQPVRTDELCITNK